MSRPAVLIMVWMTVDDTAIGCVPETRRVGFTLFVSTDGMVDLTCLVDYRDAECSASTMVAMSWATSLAAHGLCKERKCELVSLVCATWLCASTAAFHRQLVTAIANHLQGMCIKTLTKGRASPLALHATTVNLKDCLTDGKQLGF